MSLGQKDKVLIICYSFPPHPGIGGRRWAKFSKTLSAKGYEIFIVGASNFSNSTSFWSKDVEKEKIKIKTFEFKFQKIIKYPKSVLEKFVRKIVLSVINITKYNADIITSLPNKNVWNGISDLIEKEKIKKVIVSGDPYLFYYASKLKKKLDFELTLDYRDLWNDHTFYDTKVKLSARQKQYFELAENFAVNNCDKIIFVDEYIKSVVEKRITSKTVSTFVIHNGFDKDDLAAGVNEKTQNEVINVFFAGSISSDLNAALIEFVSAFEKLSKIDSSLYNKFFISIFGEMDHALVRKIAEFKLANLNIENKTLNIGEYYEQLKKIDIGLVILSDEYKNSFVTKFTDYLFYEKYIAVLGFKGYFTEYVEKQNIGLGFDASDPVTFFKNLRDSYNNRKIISANEKEKFDLHVLTQKLIREVIEN
ncbi:MAG: hypothetical protein JNJ41_17285 [Bacteroidia bacterium]|nr:hypothetical protein [Bacteroidia bacterium]